MQFVTISCVANTRPLDLDIPNGTLDPVQIQQFPRNGLTGSLNQQWSLVGSSISAYDRIVSRATGMALEADVNTNRVTNGGFHGGLAQQWFLFNESASAFVLFSGMGPGVGFNPAGLVMDLPLPRGVDNVSPIQLFPVNQGRNQQWVILNSVNIPAFAIFSRANHLVLDVPGFTIADNNPINQFTYNGGSNQLWEFVRTDGSGNDEASPQSGQTYFIRSVCNGRVLEFPNGNDFVSLQQAALTQENNQRWLLIDGRNSSFLIQNVATEKFITGPSSNNAGVATEQRPAGAGAYQEWWPKSVPWLFASNPLDL